MSDYLFLTGGTGLLGRYLIRDLMQRGQRLALLVRDSKRETAHQRIESILQYWERLLGRSFPRPVLLTGDIRQPLLGLNGSDRGWLARHCKTVMHSAASLEFHTDGNGEPWQTNFDGTRSMLELCRAVGLSDLHYVSTAYVCGLREGTILESELDCGQRFRNDYEVSKLKAECMVREADFLDRLTVYRPAVISGDSKTGYTNTYHGIYLYLRMMALFAPRHPIGPDGVRVTPFRMPMTGYERRNVIPVDWVSEVMTELYFNTESHGHTFHLAPEHCLTPRQVIEAGYTYYNSTGVEWVGYDQLESDSYTELEAAALPGLTMYHNYENTDPTFDCTNLRRFAGSIPCPTIDESMLHSYIQFGEQDRWGKRRPEKPNMEASASDYFSMICVADDQSRAASKQRLAIDLSGPGGGQWTLGLQPDGTFICSTGLHADADSLLRLKTADFLEMVSPSNGDQDAQVLDQFFPLSASDGLARAIAMAQRENAC